MSVRRAYILIGFVISVLGPGVGNAASDKEKCSYGADRDRQLEGCTAMIRSGNYSGKELAWAYTKRGFANQGLGNDRKALADFDKSISLDPDDVSLYQFRGEMYRKLCKPDSAVRDMERHLQNSSSEVIEMNQSFLKSEGHYSGEVDGVFSPALRQALEAYAKKPEC